VTAPTVPVHMDHCRRPGTGRIEFSANVAKRRLRHWHITPVGRTEWILAAKGVGPSCGDLWLTPPGSLYGTSCICTIVGSTWNRNTLSGTAGVDSVNPGP